ncbi:MAG: mobilization protein [Alteromonas sp.]|nr:mobilization protein [Alteromonas sp.]
MVDKSKRLEALKKKQSQISAQIKSMEAAEKTRERKRDTRRKILIGAYYLEQAASTEQWAEMVQRMDGYLKRNSDRILFDLAPLESDPSTNDQPG